MDAAESGRFRQRRRTRAAIVAAAGRLLAAGGTPSMSAIAAEADVSRRTLYLHFPTLEQLLLDATLGRLSPDLFDVTEGHGDGDPRELVRRRIAAIVDQTAMTLPLGRSLVRLTVDGPTEAAEVPKRGYRRVGWVEQALEPIRERLGADDHERLVSSLAVVVGWEALIVLQDVRGLSPAAGAEVMQGMADALVDAALEPSGRQPGG